MPIDTSLLRPVAQPEPFNFAALQQSMLQGQQRDTNLSAGDLAAQGNYQGAAARAFQGGNAPLAGQMFDAGNAQHAAGLKSAIQALTPVNTPADWNKARAAIIRGGGQDPGDFSQKDKVIGQLTDALDPEAAANRKQSASQFAQTQALTREGWDKPVAQYPGMEWVRPSEAVKAANGPTPPVDQGTITSKYNVVLDPDQAARFALIPENRRMKAASLLNGSMVINDIPGGVRNPMRIQAIQDAKTVDPTYDEVSSKAGNTFEQSKMTQQFIANANTASSTVDRLVELSNKIDRGNLTILNNGELALKSGTSDPTTKQYLTEYNILADELGKILGSGQGSDFAIKLGQSLIDPNASKDAVAAQGAEVKGRINNKLAEYKKQFRQGGGVQTPDAGQPQGQGAPNRFDQLFGTQPGVQTAGAGGVGTDPAAIEAEMRRRGFIK